MIRLIWKTKPSFATIRPKTCGLAWSTQNALEKLDALALEIRPFSHPVAGSRHHAEFEILAAHGLYQDCQLEFAAAGDDKGIRFRRLFDLERDVAFGLSQPHAVVDISNDSSINASGNLDISTDSESELAIFATQNLIGTSSTVEKYNITLAGAYSNTVSEVTLSSDS